MQIFRRLNTYYSDRIDTIKAKYFGKFPDKIDEQKIKWGAIFGSF